MNQPPNSPDLPGAPQPGAPQSGAPQPGADQPPSDPYSMDGGYAAPNGQQQPGSGQMPGAQLPISDNDRTLAILAHLSIVAGTLLSVGFLSWVGPLIIYLTTAQDRPFPRQAAAGALNFAIVLLIGQMVAGGLVFLGTLLMVILIGFIPLALGGLLAVALWIWSIVIPILAAMAASRNEAYRYPLTPTIIR